MVIRHSSSRNLIQDFPHGPFHMDFTLARNYPFMGEPRNARMWPFFSHELLSFSNKESCVWKATCILRSSLGGKGFEASDHSVRRFSVNSATYIPMPNSCPCCTDCPQILRIFSLSLSSEKSLPPASVVIMQILDSILCLGCKQGDRLPHAASASSPHSPLYRIPQRQSYSMVLPNNLLSPCWCPCACTLKPGIPRSSCIRCFSSIPFLSTKIWLKYFVN